MPRRSTLPLLVVSLLTVTTSAIDLLVPAYANPCCGDGPRMWSTLAQMPPQDDDDGVQIHIILNPASGPGDSPIDPNYIGVDGTGPLVDVVAATVGQTPPRPLLYGYVATGFGARPLEDMQNDIDRYYNDPSYWRGTAVRVAGIFFDEMSSATADLPLYQSLRAYVRQQDPAAIVMANPGVAVPEEFFRTVVADTIVTFEQTALAYRTTYESPGAWTTNYDPDRFAHLIHTTTTTMGIDEMRSIVELAQMRHVGFLYVTDDPFVVLDQDNPWDTLATFWDTLVEAVAETNNEDGGMTDDGGCVWDGLLQILQLFGGLLEGLIELLDSVLCGR